MDSRVQENLNTGGAALGFEHVENRARGTVAEELAERLLVIRDAMFFDQGDEVAGRVTRQRRLREVRIRRKEIFRLAVNVGEVAAAAAGDEDLLARAIGVLEDGDAASALARFDGAHQSGGAGTKNDCVEAMRGHWSVWAESCQLLVVSCQSVTSLWQI